MKAAAFDYVRAETLDQTLRLLAERGEGARILAGGQSLVPALNLRLASPDLLVDIGGLTDLRYIEPLENGLRLGALTRHVDIARSDWIARHCPLLSRAIAHVAHAAIRNRGTLGGSLAHADPAAELPACMLALNAEIVATGPLGERRIRADDFFLGIYETALCPGEVLTSVEIAGLDSGRRYGFAELSRRRGDFAIVGLALAGRAHATTLTDLRLAFFGVADRPVLAPAAASALANREIGPATLEAARAALADDLDPVSDAQASGAMRLHLAGVLLERAVGEALGLEAAK
jgi:aerobic carbon-monoxide dehydrogenase medium subunit